MASLEILKAAKAKIEDPNKWTQSSYARDYEGKEVRYSDPHAATYCVMGALYASGAPYCDADESLLLEQAARELGYVWDAPVLVNDELGHAETIAMLDKAIEIAEKELANLLNSCGE